LSNYSFDTARVETVITNGPDCTAGGTAAAVFVMPLNATRIIAVPPGADICWRLEAPEESRTSLGAALGTAPPPIPGWANWNRAYTGSGRFIDARL
jgi:hypothetical protein